MTLCFLRGWLLTVSECQFLILTGDHWQPGVLNAAGTVLCCVPMSQHHTEISLNASIFTGQLSLWGRVGVTTGLLSVQEGQRCRWGLIKQPSLKRRSRVSHPPLYSSVECLVALISRTFLILPAALWPVTQTLENTLGGFSSWFRQHFPHLSQILPNNVNLGCVKKNIRCCQCFDYLTFQMQQAIFSRIFWFLWLNVLFSYYSFVSHAIWWSGFRTCTCGVYHLKHSVYHLKR